MSVVMPRRERANVDGRRIGFSQRCLQAGPIEIVRVILMKHGAPASQVEQFNMLGNRGRSGLRKGLKGGKQSFQFTACGGTRSGYRYRRGHIENHVEPGRGMHAGGPLQPAPDIRQIPTVGRFLFADELHRGQIAPRVGQRIAGRRHAKLRLPSAVLTRGGIEDCYGKPVISRQNEGRLCVLQVRGCDVLVEFAEFDGAVALITIAVGIRELDKEYQVAIAATSLQVPAIQFDFNPRYEPLVKREFGAGDTHAPVKVRLNAFAEPLIEGDLSKCRINRAALAGRLGQQGSAEAQEYEIADHSSFYN
jgi:hypothetical protein